MTTGERSAAESGIWLCQTRSRLIDVYMHSHTIEQLREWKTLAELREDIANSPFTRELIAFKKGWNYGGQDRPYFTYYCDDHDELLGKLHVMENYGALVDVKFNEVYRYEMTEDFVEYLLMPR